jgi:Na+/glutamate symporter
MKFLQSCQRARSFLPFNTPAADTTGSFSGVFTSLACSASLISRQFSHLQMRLDHNVFTSLGAWFFSAASKHRVNCRRAIGIAWSAESQVLVKAKKIFSKMASFCTSVRPVTGLIRDDTTIVGGFGVSHASITSRVCGSVPSSLTLSRLSSPCSSGT